MNIERINELSKLETLKLQFAFLLFLHHEKAIGNLEAGKQAAFKAAEEFIEKLYPFVVLNSSESTQLVSYIATTWPTDQTVFERFLLLKEAEAQGEFYPNKAQFISVVTNILDGVDDELKALSPNSKRYKKLKSLRKNALESSKLLHDLMNWNF